MNGAVHRDRSPHVAAGLTTFASAATILGIRENQIGLLIRAGWLTRRTFNGRMHVTIDSVERLFRRDHPTYTKAFR